MIPVNAFSILKMLRKILYTVCLSMGMLLAAEPVSGGVPWGSPCEKMLKRNAKKLQQVSVQLQRTVPERFDTILPLFNYAFSDTSVRVSSLLAEVQTELSVWEGSTSSCADRACLMLAESYFYQCDYDNVRKYLHLLRQRHTDSAMAANAELLLLRTAVADARWDEAEQLLERHSYKVSQTVKGTADERLFALYRADYLLHILNNPIEKLAVLDTLEAFAALSDTMRCRIAFIRGQLLRGLDRNRDACRSFNEVLGHCANGAMYAYAFVYRDACLAQIAANIRDSIDAEAVRMANRIPFEPTMVESCHDSDFIYALYPYYFQDMASRFFLDEAGDVTGNDSGEDTLDLENAWYDDNDTTGVSPEMLSMVFENWDSVSIHIPKADFSHLEDTIYLPLVDSSYRMPPFTEVTSEFGWRRYRYHYGVDTKNRTGDTIRCIFDGYVRIAKRSRTYGNVVVVRHLNGLETFYAHCSKLLVTQNQEVRAGDVVALVGSTGRSTGPHLHFEVRYKGVPFNPRHIIDFDSNRLRSDTLKITRETFNYLKPYGGSASAASSKAVYYKVRPGDTLSQIARRNHTTVAAIKRLNGLRSDFIRDGQRLRVR